MAKFNTLPGSRTAPGDAGDEQQDQLHAGEESPTPRYISHDTCGDNHTRGVTRSHRSEQLEGAAASGFTAQGTVLYRRDEGNQELSVTLQRGSDHAETHGTITPPEENGNDCILAASLLLALKYGKPHGVTDQKNTTNRRERDDVGNSRGNPAAQPGYPAYQQMATAGRVQEPSPPATESSISASQEPAAAQCCYACHAAPTDGVSRAIGWSRAEDGRGCLTVLLANGHHVRLVSKYIGRPRHSRSAVTTPAADRGVKRKRTDSD